MSSSVLPNFIAATVTRVAARIAMIYQCQDLALGRGSSTTTNSSARGNFRRPPLPRIARQSARRVQRNPRMATSAKDATARIDPLHFVKVRERPRRLHCALLHVHPAVSARFTPDLRTPRTLHASPAHHHSRTLSWRRSCATISTASRTRPMSSPRAPFRPRPRLSMLGSTRSIVRSRRR